MFFRSTVNIARVARPMAVRGYADKSTLSFLFPVTKPANLSSFTAVAEKVGETVKKVAQSFSADGGAVGSKFRADGEIGQVGEKSASIPFFLLSPRLTVSACSWWYLLRQAGWCCRVRIREGWSYRWNWSEGF